MFIKALLIGTISFFEFVFDYNTSTVNSKIDYSVKSIPGKHHKFCPGSCSIPYNERDQNSKAETYGEIIKGLSGIQNGNKNIYWISSKIINDLKPAYIKIK